MKRKGLWVAVVLVGVMIVGIWLINRPPRVVLASEDEVRRAFDIRLTAPLETDREAEDRGRRFLLCFGKPHGDREAKIEKALAVTREGPLLSAPTGSAVPEEVRSTVWFELKDILDLQIEKARQQKDSDARASAGAVSELVELVDAYEALPRGMHEMSLVAKWQTQVMRACLEIAPYLDDASLKSLIRVLDRRTEAAAMWKRSARREVQEFWVPVLAQPSDWVLYGHGDVIGSYDALETTRMVSSQYVAILDGLDKPVPASIEAETEADRLVRSVPADVAKAERDAVQGRLKHGWRRLRVSIHSNTAAARLVGNVHPGNALKSYALARTAREIANMALRYEAFRREHGALPKEWRQATQREPLDYFDMQLLRHELEAGKIWSAGVDLVDNIGEFEAPLDPKGPDFGVALESLRKRK